MAKPRLLFISNLFPDTREPYRGLDNATILHGLTDRWDVATLAVRPVLPFARRGWQPREIDRILSPRFVACRYVPKIGHAVNHKLMAAALRPALAELRGAFSVALSSWIYPDCCAVSLLARELGFPFVAIAQGSDVHQYLAIPKRCAIIRSHLPSAQTIITRSVDLARRLDEEAGLPTERIVPIYNGIDLERFQPGDKEEVRKELSLPQGGRIVLFVGNFVAIKNPLLLIDAFLRLREERDFEDITLVMVGGGPLEGTIAFRADRPQTEGRILLAGRQMAPTVAKFMQAADVLCLPSDLEGLPNVVLEAFASGLRVVASRVGGIPEVHNADSLGRLVPPRDLDALTDALRVVLAAQPDRDRIRRHAEKFTWQRAADAYHGVLSRAAA